MSKVTVLSRESIFSASDIETEEVYVPEWKGSVFVRGLTAGQREKWLNVSITLKGKNQEVSTNNAKARLVVMAIVDGDGKLLFTEADILKLGQKSAVAIDRIYEVAARLSGISDGDPEDIAKNFASDQADDSSSA